MSKVNFYNQWFYGANFIPSNAINQLEMWQEETFDPEIIDRELGYAEKIGMNIMRVFLHDLLWFQDSKGFIERIEKYLEIAESRGIKTMLVIFDDCWNDNAKLGKQPDPVPMVHNSGWVRSPNMEVEDNPEKRAALEVYVKGIMSNFANDERIVAWDLFNEPGNGTLGVHGENKTLRINKSFPMLQDVFRWAREVNPSQPLTVGVWNSSEAFKALSEYSIEHSDIVSFHTYGDMKGLASKIEELKKLAGERPIVCTEYMARHVGSTFKDCLTLMKEKNVSAINWGLVSGKTQTIYPWKNFKVEDESLPFHDVFNADGSLLIPEEQEIFDKIMRR